MLMPFIHFQSILYPNHGHFSVNYYFIIFAKQNFGRSKFVWKWVRVVRINFRCREDWSELLQEWMGFIRIPLKVCVGLIRIPSAVGGNGQNSFRSGQDKSDFL